MGIGYHMHKLARLKTRYLGHHHYKRCILSHIPCICSQHILRALIKDGTKFALCYIEGHAVCARVKRHFMQILKIIHIGHYSAAARIIFKIVQHAIHHVETAFLILMLYSHLIAVCLADRAVFLSPTVPYMAVQIVHIIGFFLPYPKHLVHCKAKIYRPYGNQRKFL